MHILPSTETSIAIFDACEKVPFLSILPATYTIYSRCIHSSAEKAPLDSDFHAHILRKSSSRALLLCLPVIGNAVVYKQDIDEKARQNLHELFDATIGSLAQYNEGPKTKEQWIDGMTSLESSLSIMQKHLDALRQDPELQSFYEQLQQLSKSFYSLRIPLLSEKESLLLNTLDENIRTLKQFKETPSMVADTRWFSLIKQMRIRTELFKGFEKDLFFKEYLQTISSLEKELYLLRERAYRASLKDLSKEKVLKMLQIPELTEKFTFINQIQNEEDLAHFFQGPVPPKELSNVLVSFLNHFIKKWKSCPELSPLEIVELEVTLEVLRTL